MKKIIGSIAALIMLSLLITGISGCSSKDIKDNGVASIKEDLISLAQKNSEKYFSKTIAAKDFDISLAEEVKENEYKSIEKLDGVKKVVLFGHFKDNPVDVVDFVLSYDVQEKKMLKFGIMTLQDDKMVYANLKN